LKEKAPLGAPLWRKKACAGFLDQKLLNELR
jgi:hypothetical protein